MAAVDVNRQTIWEDGDATEMARFQVNGVNGVQADVTSIVRKVFDLASDTPTTAIATDTLTVANVVFDTLQTDARWTKDSTGYNFRDRIAGTNFPTGGHTYRVEYFFTGSASESFFVVFEHPARKVHSS